MCVLWYFDVIAHFYFSFYSQCLCAILRLTLTLKLVLTITLYHKPDPNFNLEWQTCEMAGHLQLLFIGLKESISDAYRFHASIPKS